MSLVSGVRFLRVVFARISRLSLPRYTEVQRGVVIGSNTRIQSHSFVCSNVSIGSHCFIGHGVHFVNDRFSTGKVEFDPAKWEFIRVGDHVIIGSNCTVLPCTIAPHVIVGAGSVVTRDLTKPGIYMGTPARWTRSV